MNIITFDIGGTWFRSGLFTDKQELLDYRKDIAINFKNNPDSSSRELQTALCDFIIRRCLEIKTEFGNKKISNVSISMGAALNGNNGIIYNSGPLWGKDSEEYDLATALSSRIKELDFHVINDVTAALYANIDRFDNEYSKRIALITVSSGIAMRVYDKDKSIVSINEITGLQGEIGHIPIKFMFRDEAVSLNCDCGNLNHLNAFCSGRGIIKLIKELKQKYPEDFKTSTLSKVDFSNADSIFNAFVKSLEVADIISNEILCSITDAIIEVLVCALVVDPEISKIIITGGVTKTLHRYFIDSLNKSFHKVGMYQVSNRFPNFLSDMWIVSEDNDVDGMIGSAKYVIAAIKNKKSNENAWRIRYNQNISYTIYKSNNIFKLKSNNFLEEYDCKNKFLIFVDSVVYSLHKTLIEDYFNSQNIIYEVVLIKSTEQLKSLETILFVLKTMTDFGLNRRSNPVITIGGGVLMDIVGFACSVFRRCTPYIRIPTTLLGIVDASIGVKTAINFESKKNSIGTYFAPSKVILDYSFIKTQDRRHIVNGVAEILKIALIMDESLFILLEEYGKAAIERKFSYNTEFESIIERSIEGMLEELIPNLHETNLERKVDFGHTFSQELEMQAGERLLHGEAVSIDMVISSIIAYKKGVLEESQLYRVIKLIKELGLPYKDDLCSVSLMKKSIIDATKHRNGHLRMPIPTRIGHSKFLNDVSDKDIEQTLDYLFKL